jgi:hypothetical protein
MAGSLGEVADKRIILYILVCSNYLLSLPPVLFPIKTLGKLGASLPLIEEEMM